MQESANIYNFSNIHFASAPLFSQPRPITHINRTINTGQTSGICAQSIPWWEVASAQISASPNNASLENIKKTYTSIENMYNTGNASLESLSLSLSQLDPRTVQECLTLDVVVPKGIWNAKDQKPVERGTH